MNQLATKPKLANKTSHKVQPKSKSTPSEYTSKSSTANTGGISINLGGPDNLDSDFIEI